MPVGESDQPPHPTAAQRRQLVDARAAGAVVAPDHHPDRTVDRFPVVIPCRPVGARRPGQDRLRARGGDLEGVAGAGEQ